MRDSYRMAVVPSLVKTIPDEAKRILGRQAALPQQMSILTRLRLTIAFSRGLHRCADISYSKAH
jgi:hypothetical protein